MVKAHKVLTSPVAARNYAKFGSPDGYQGFKFGIALPAWAMTEQAFLACFLVVVLVVPLLFFLCLRDPKVPLTPKTLHARSHGMPRSPPPLPHTG